MAAANRRSVAKMAASDGPTRPTAVNQGAFVDADGPTIAYPSPSQPPSRARRGPGSSPGAADREERDPRREQDDGADPIGRMRSRQRRDPTESPAHVTAIPSPPRFRPRSPDGLRPSPPRRARRRRTRLRPRAQLVVIRSTPIRYERSAVDPGVVPRIGAAVAAVVELERIDEADLVEQQHRHGQADETQARPRVSRATAGRR